MARVTTGAPYNVRCSYSETVSQWSRNVRRGVSWACFWKSIMAGVWEADESSHADYYSREKNCGQFILYFRTPTVVVSFKWAPMLSRLFTILNNELSKFIQLLYLIHSLNCYISKFPHSIFLNWLSPGFAFIYNFRLCMALIFICTLIQHLAATSNKTNPFFLSHSSIYL